MNKWKKWAYISLLLLLSGVISFRLNCNIAGYCLGITYSFINIKIFFEYVNDLLKKG